MGLPSQESVRRSGLPSKEQLVEVLHEMVDSKAAVDVAERQLVTAKAEYSATVERFRRMADPSGEIQGEVGALVDLLSVAVGIIQPLPKPTPDEDTPF